MGFLQEVRADMQRVDLDAMIPREDFGVLEDSYVLDLMSDFPIRHLTKDAPVLRLLRKPDFQRETNHWSPDQLVTLIESFVDNEVIPSLILWKAPRFIFVIDGGHRLSALRAWMEDDYGDKHISKAFYKKEIPKKQIAIAERTRRLVESRVGRYTDLIAQIDIQTSTETQKKRAQALVTRALPLQWIQGNALAAETSFFKINSQGTPLDETETLLIKNRKKPIAISARAIVRAGSGHKYWSAFPPERIAGLKIRERIRALVQFRLDAILHQKEALRRAQAIMAMPQNALRAAKLGWHSADAMWRLAGDTATDYNHYTKRLTLGSIYAATLAVYVSDTSGDHADTRAFLERRIDGIMTFEKAKARLLKPRDEQFSVARLLGRLRYPAQ